jgi:hypothetical protein
MLTISGFRGANCVGVERMARTVGLDMISIIVVLVVAFGHDDDVAVRRRWFVGLEVPWLTEENENETVPRALTDL